MEFGKPMTQDEARKNSTVTPPKPEFKTPEENKKPEFKTSDTLTSDNVKGWLKNTASKVKKAGQDAYTGAKKALTDQVNEAKDIGGKIKKGLGEGLNSVKEGIKSMGEQQARNAASADYAFASPDTRADVEMETPKGKEIVDNAVDKIENKKPEEPSKDAVTEGNSTVPSSKASTEAEPTEAESSETDLTSLEVGEDDMDSQNQVLQAAEGAGLSPDSTPEEGVQTVKDVMKQLQDSGLFEFTEDGKVKFKGIETTKPTTRENISRLFTVLSIAATIATGGALPPLNFMKLTGAEEDKENRDLQRKQYEQFMNNISNKLGDALAGTIKSKSLTKDTSEGIGETEYSTSGAKAAAKDNQEFQEKIKGMDKDIQKELMAYKSELDDDSREKAAQNDFERQIKLLHETSKTNLEFQQAMAEFLNELDVKKVPAMIAYAATNPEMKGILTRKNLDLYAKMQKAVGGTTTLDKVLDNTSKITGAFSNVADTLMNAATGGLLKAAAK